MLLRQICVLCSLEWLELITDQEQQSSLGWVRGLDGREGCVARRWIYQLLMSMQFDLEKEMNLVTQVGNQKTKVNHLAQAQRLERVILQEEHNWMLVQLRDFPQEVNSLMLEQDWRNLIQVELELHSLVVVKEMFGKIQLVDYKNRVCCSWMKNLKDKELDT